MPSASLELWEIPSGVPNQINLNLLYLNICQYTFWSGGFVSADRKMRIAETWCDIGLQETGSLGLFAFLQEYYKGNNPSV